MIIQAKSDLFPGVASGEVLQFTREGTSLLYKGTPIFRSLPESMQRDTYYGTVTVPDVLHTTISVSRFADLHRHSDCSLLDGITKIKDMVKASVPIGALTDHGNMYGFLEHYKSMRKVGKKPIIGFEAYVEDLDGNLNGDHLILLAKTLTGCHNLFYLTSESFEHKFRGHPHVTIDMLKKYSEGVIATSACISGTIAKLIRKGDMEKAKYALKVYQDIFGEDFYLEVQRHGIRDEQVVEQVYHQWSKELGIKVIATTDSHYLEYGDADAHEVALCMQTGKLLSEPHMKFDGTGYHIHTSEEMESLFSDWPETLENTLELADKCDVTLKLGEVNLPKYPIPAPFKDPTEYFEYLCKEGFIDRFKGTPMYQDPEYKERYEYEMAMIQKMGFVSYFIIVWDFINYARSNDIYVGPGRGSAAGSLLAYCIGITDLDPIKYKLIFERFLNPERISWPDVDTDIEHSRRPDVIKYLKDKYGADHVSQIITFGTLAAKMAIKDIGKVMGFSPSFCGALAKLVPSEVKMTIDKALEVNPEFEHRYETEDNVRKIVDMAKKLEGNKRHASQHACGTVIGPSKISDFMPTAMIKNDETGEVGITTQVIMTEVEELSLLKMDLLGLKNLSVIHDCINDIKKKTGKSMDYHDIPLDDREVFKFLRDGHTGGVFQLESPGMTKVVQQMLVDADTLPYEERGQFYERMIACVALYRPGPMDYIPDYTEGMRNPMSVHYDCAEEKSVLESTYGVLVYQEQLMQIAQKLAGYNLGEADLLRKACGKKKIELMNEEHSRFVSGNKNEYEAGKAKHLIPGCVGNGIEKGVAEEIWSKMVKFASYAFNRSHAACYAYVAILTAWLSYYYPCEFYAGMLNAFNDSTDKFVTYLSQINKRNIKMLPPDINISAAKFAVDGDSIRFGLRGIKGMNKEAVLIEAEREANGPFKSFQDLYERMNEAGAPIEKKTFEALLYSGALDSFGHTRASLLKAFPMFVSGAASEKKRIAGQMSLFSGDFGEDLKKYSIVEIPEVDELDKRKLMDEEHEMLGFYLSEHPVENYELHIPKRYPFETLDDLQGDEPRYGKVITVGLIRDLRHVFTRNGDLMYLFTLENKKSAVPCVVFPRSVPECQTALVDGHVAMLNGNYTNDEDHGNQLIVNTMIPESNVLQEMFTSKPKLFVPVSSKEEQDKALALAQEFQAPSEELGNQLYLAVGNKLYPKKKKLFIRLSMETLDEFLKNFPKAKLGTTL